MKLGYDTTLGFATTKTPMQKVHAENTLNKLQRFDGVTMTEKEIVVNHVLLGFVVDCVDNYTYVKRDGEMSKPKTIYRLFTNTNRTAYFEISKTAFDFANYLIENNLITLDSITAYVDAETAENERLEAELIAEQERKVKEHQDRVQADKEQSRIMREQRSNEFKEKASALLSDEQIKGIKTIIFNLAKEYMPNESDDKLNALVENSSYITSIGNETGTKQRVNYLFLESDSETVARNINTKIEKAVFSYVFDLSDTDTKLTIKDKLNKLYTGTDKKRYYHGAEIEHAKVIDRVTNLLTSIVTTSSDKTEFNYNVRQNRETLKNLIDKVSGLQILIKPEYLIVKHKDSEIEIPFNFAS